MSEHCLLPERCTCVACRADAYKERAEAAEAKLAAIDALLPTHSAGPPEMAPLLDDLFRILHPEEGQ